MTPLLRRWTAPALAWSVAAMALVVGIWGNWRAYAVLGGPYVIGDWLINYAGGFVRRGLFGAIYLAVFPAGQQGLWWLFGLQLVLCLVPFAYAMGWLHRTGYDWRAIALVLGPAAFTFLGWDPGGFARKESLTLTALTLLAIAAAPRRGDVARGLLLLGALLLFAVGVLSWEGSAMALPAVLYLLARATDRHRQERWLAGGLAIAIAVGGLAASILAPRTAATRVAVCEAVRAKGLDHPRLCEGAISYIGWTSDQMVAHLRGNFPFYWGFFLLIALGLIPLLTTHWARRHWLLALSCAVAVAPLFLIATDYGRWASLVVVELVLCLMATESRVTGPGDWSPGAAALYVTTWGLPHWLDASQGSWPWLGALHEVLDLVARHGPHI